MGVGLVGKDYKIILRENAGTFVVQMLFLLVMVSANLGILGYSTMVTAGAWFLLMNVSAAEHKNGALAYLVSTPYSRWKIIISRYVSSALLFVLLTVVYGIISAVIGMAGVGLFPMLTVPVVAGTFVYYMLFVSITAPMYFFLEDMTVRLVSVGMILGVGFLMAIIMFKTDLSTLAIILDAVPAWGAPAGGVLTAVSVVASVVVTKVFFDKLEF